MLHIVYYVLQLHIMYGVTLLHGAAWWHTLAQLAIQTCFMSASV